MQFVMRPGASGLQTLARRREVALTPPHHQGFAHFLFELTNERADRRLRDEKPLGSVREASGLADERQRLELPKRHVHARSNSNSPFFQSTLMASFSANLPSRIMRAMGFSTSCWMVRLSGRAPNTGSKPSLAS